MARALITFLILFVTLQSLLGQVPYFQKYFLLKKNQPVHVNKIFQDRAGFIWYGTNAGLFKFDGIHIQHYTIQTGLLDNNISAIAQDSLGRIWTGYKNGKISILDKNGIVKFDPEEGTSTEEISDIIFDKKANLWFSTLNDGVYCYTNNRLYRYDEDNGLPDIFIYDLAEDDDGNIWIGTDGGVVSCKMNNGEIIVKVSDDRNGLPDNIVKKILTGDNKSIFMATEDAGVVFYNAKTNRYARLMNERWQWGSIVDFVISDSKIWIALQQDGLLVFDLETKQLKQYSNLLEPTLTSISTLMNDNEGNIWIGSKTGVARSFGDHIESLDNFDITKDTNILSLTFDKEGDLWFSNSEGLFRRHMQHNKAVITRQLNDTQFQKYTIVSLYCDSKGSIWAGLYGEGVLRIDPNSNKVEHISKQLRNGNVLNITGKGDIVWLATLGGSTRINIAGGKLDVTTYSKADGLISDYIYQVFVDSRDRVWFATDGRGADMLDTQGFHHYENGFNSKVVYGFVEDGNHDVWINVQGDGLYKFESKKFQKELDLKLRDNNVVAMNVDKFGNVIVMHDLGIDVVDVTQNRVHYLSDEKSISGKMANLNATTKDKYDRVYFGTDGGIISSLSIASQKLKRPMSSITGLKILNEKVELTQGLTLAYNQNSITLDYLGMWYQNPDDLKFQYLLSNYDRGWIESSDRSATYSSLPPGDYTFSVRASETENFDNSVAASYHFVILPPFWKTGFFYIFSVFIIALLSFGFIKYRERRLLHDKLILKYKVEARTIEILRKNEEINAQAEEIRGINENLEMMVRDRTIELERKNKALEESAFIIAHELRAPVASILGLINLMSRAELDVEGRVIVNHMIDSANRLNLIVRSITEAIEQGDSGSN